MPCFAKLLATSFSCSAWRRWHRLQDISAVLREDTSTCKTSICGAERRCQRLQGFCRVERRCQHFKTSICDAARRCQRLPDYTSGAWRRCQHLQDIQLLRDCCNGVRSCTQRSAVHGTACERLRCVAKMHVSKGLKQHTVHGIVVVILLPRSAKM